MSFLEQERGYQQDDVVWWNHEEFSSIDQHIGALSFSIHCTPGHTPGHVTIIGNGIVVTGDCLFLGRCGRTDLFGGDQSKQRKSLRYLRDFLLNLMIPLMSFYPAINMSYRTDQIQLY